MGKYIKVIWPEIQDYMSHPKYDEEVSFDPIKDCWFIPEEWELNEIINMNDYYDLENEITNNKY